MAEKAPNFSSQLQAMADQIRAWQEEMQSYYDDRSAAWQESDAGTDYQCRIEQIERAADAVEDCCTES